MKVDLQIDEKYVPPVVEIKTNQINEEINQVLNFFNQQTTELVGLYQEKQYLLLITQITRIFAQDKRVIAVMDGQEYQLRMPLYEVEKQVREQGFIRISRSELVNRQAIDNFDLTFSGSIRVNLRDGSSTFVSRRFVNAIKGRFNL